MRTESNWIQTATGVKFWPLDPDPADVRIIDIAHSLSNRCRFSGHCNRFYSVAEHSAWVAVIVSNLGGTIEDQLKALLHDACEAYMPDVAAPIKRELPDIQRMEARLTECVFKSFGLTQEIPEIVHRADKIALAIEAPVLMGEMAGDWKLVDVPNIARFKEMKTIIERTLLPRDAFESFLEVFKVLSSKHEIRSSVAQPVPVKA